MATGDTPPTSGGGGGGTVVTSLVGLTESDGAQVWLKVGDSRRTFTFDSTLGRWISEPWIAQASIQDISHNTTVSTVSTSLFRLVDDYANWYSAGAHLQFRIMWVWWNDSNSVAELDFFIWGGNAGTSWAAGGIQILASYGQNFAPATSTPIYAGDLSETSWRDFSSNLSGYDNLAGQFGLRSNASPGNTITHLAMMNVACRLASV